MSLLFCVRSTRSICCVLLLNCVSLTAEAGEVFVADRATNRILSFDETSGDFLRVVTDQGLDQPSGMTFGGDGFLYVTNSVSGFPGSAASVVKVDPVNGTTTDFITNVGGAGGIAYHAASNSFFVSEFGNFDGDEVFRYDASGAPLQTLGTGSSPSGRGGIAFDDAGNLYVSEFNVVGFGSILKYDAPLVNPSDPFSTMATTFAAGSDVTLAIPAPASGFNGLAFDSSGDLFVASLIGQAVIKFDVEAGEVVSGSPFGAPLPYPSGVLVGDDGNILATSLGNDNPSDPFYGPNLFPGSITRFNQFFQGQAPFLVGDVNRDTVVDEADLLIWQEYYGVTYDPMNPAASADLDGDFDTDGRDFLAWQRGFGNSGVSGSFQPTALARYVPVLATTAIPEPSSAVIALLALSCGAWFRRSHRG